MTDIAKLRIEADSRQVRTANKDLNQFKKRGSGASSALKGLKTAFLALGTAISTREIVRYADQWQSSANKIGTIIDGSKADIASLQSELLQLANQTRSNFGATSNLFTRLSRSTGELDLSNKEMISITRTINQAFAVSGATADEASNAITQLSQGLAAGALRGEEFNSVAEQAPILMRAIGNSLDKNVGELREFAAEGKITSEIVINALMGAADGIDKEFQSMTATFGQNMTVANNNLQEFIGSSTTIQGVVSGVGGAIVSASENLDDFADDVGTFRDAMKISFGGFVDDTADSLEIMDDNFGKLFTSINKGGLTLSGSLSLVFGSLIIEARTAVQVLTVQTASAFDQAQTHGSQVAGLFGDVMNLVGAGDTEMAKTLIATRQRFAATEGGVKGRITAIEAARDKALEKFKTSNTELQNTLIDNIIEAEKEEAEFKRTSTAATQLAVDTRSLAVAQGENATETGTSTTATKNSTTALSANSTAVSEVVTELGRELQALKLSSIEQQVANRIRQTGNVITFAEADAIRDSVTELEEYKTELEESGTESDRTRTTIEETSVAMGAQETALDSMQRAWADMFFDMELTADGFFDSVLDGFRRMIAEMMAADLRNAIFGGQGLDAFTSGNTVDALGNLGDLFTGGGDGGGPSVNGASFGNVSSAVTAAMNAAGFSSAATVTGSTITGGAGPLANAMASFGGTGGGLLSGIGSFLTNPATLGVGAALLLADHFNKESTPSSNAGFLVGPAPGVDADRQFDIDPFDSGLQARGFARRADQSDAEAAIDPFRELDARITDLVTQLGGTIDLTNATLSGFDEKGQGDGVFLGLASEVGTGVTSQGIESQLDLFGGQLIDHIGGLDDELIDSVRSADSVADAVSILAIGLESMSSDSEDVSDALDEASEAMTQFEQNVRSAAETVIRAFDRGLNEADARSNAQDAFDRFADRGLTAQDIADAAGTRAQISEVMDALNINDGAANDSGTTQSPDEESTGALSILDIFSRARSIAGTLERGTITDDEMREIGQFAIDNGISSQRLARALPFSLAEIQRATADVGLPSFRTGLDRVPFDGFRAELHAGERVLTNSQARSNDNAMQGMRSEISQLRSVTSQLLTQLVLSSKDQADTLERFEFIGLPQTRTA